MSVLTIYILRKYGEQIVKKLLILTTLLAATSANVWAADSILYAGVTGGTSNYEDDDDTLMGLRVGTGILPFIDIEAGIIDLGEVSDEGASLETSTKYIAVKPTLTLPLLDVYARAGLHQWEYDWSYGGLTDSDDGTDPMYGVGVDYFISDYISLGASYTRYEIEDGEVDGYELNATFYLDLL